MAYEDQHVVSKVLLQRFAEAHVVGCFDLHTHDYETKIPNRLGTINGLVPIDAKRFEDTWEKVERKMDHAFKLVDSERLLGNKKFCDAVRDCIALHYARSHVVKAVFDHNLTPRREQVIQRMLARFPPEQIVRELSGVHVPPLTATMLAPDLLRQYTDNKVVSDNWIGQTLLDLFQEGKERTAGVPLEVWYATGADFLIGDVPVVTYNKSQDKVGMKEGIHWSQAEVVFMPLGPRHVVALAKHEGYHEANDNAALQLNILQIRNAMKQVFFRPSTGLAETLRDELKKP